MPAGPECYMGEYRETRDFLLQHEWYLHCARLTTEMPDCRKKLMQQDLGPVVEALLSLLDSRRSELTRALGLQVCSAMQPIDRLCSLLSTAFDNGAHLTILDPPPPPPPPPPRHCWLSRIVRHPRLL